MGWLDLENSGLTQAVREAGAVELLLVRHGESEGNVAATEASQAGADVIEVPARDADVTLSSTGQDQSLALGRALASIVEALRPDAEVSSPYARAYQTAEIAVETAGWPVKVRTDERFRDRELGIPDMLTRQGVERRLPEEVERRQWLGKFYYRPPGGESWADVVLRLRSVLGELNSLGSGPRVMLVCHDALILLVRYVLEGMTEAELLDLAASTSVLNASITRYVPPKGTARGRWRASTWRTTSPLRASKSPNTPEMLMSTPGSPSADGRPAREATAREVTAQEATAREVTAQEVTAQEVTAQEERRLPVRWRLR